MDKKLQWRFNITYLLIITMAVNLHLKSSFYVQCFSHRQHENIPSGQKKDEFNEVAMHKFLNAKISPKSLILLFFFFSDDFDDELDEMGRFSFRESRRNVNFLICVNFV